MGFLDFAFKVLETLAYEGACQQRNALSKAQHKAHFSGNYEAEEKIKEKRAEAQEMIDRIKEERRARQVDETVDEQNLED